MSMYLTYMYISTNKTQGKELNGDLGASWQVHHGQGLRGDLYSILLCARHFI